MKKEKCIRVGNLVNQYGYGTAAGDLTTALNEFTNIDSKIISFQKPEDFADETPVTYPDKNTNNKSFLDSILAQADNN